MLAPVAVKQPQQVNITSYSLPSGSLAGTSELRLDACYYNPTLFDVLRILDRSGMCVHHLEKITTNIVIPPRFKRIYVEANHGVPFLQGSHVVHFQPADLKYLSRLKRKLNQWIIRSGWILLTRSGTVGRAMIAPPEWDGWAASEHILRVMPDEKKCPVGYLCAFLSSPLGQVQLTANIYGAVVDELTEEQAASVSVPLPETKEDWALVQQVDKTMRQGVGKRVEAVALVNNAISQIQPSSESIAEPRHFQLPTNFLSDELRMDAGYYNPRFLHAIKLLGATRTKKLGNLAHVFMPPRLKRVYVEEEYGLPFLQGSHAIHFQPAGLKYLSRQRENIDQFIVRSGWLLVTRSGTVGRVTICPDEWTSGLRPRI